MTPSQPPTSDWSWASPSLREQLLADPVAVLRDRGVNVPDGFPPEIVHEFVRVAFLLWVDGRVVPLDQFHIDPADEGLLFGRGVWESTRTVNGVPWLWPAHLSRLRQSAEILGIDAAEGRLPSTEAAAEYVRGLTGQDVIVRLNVTAGRPGKPGLVWMSAAPLPLPPASLRLKTVRNPVRKGQAYLTLKTFQYATRLRIGQQVAKGGYDTALLVDADGNLQEASHANLFVRLPDGWVTPPADGGLLPGTVRQLVLERSPIPVREQPVPEIRLGEIREVFVTNSNVGIVPVVQIDGFAYPVGSETARLMQWLQFPAATTTQYRFVERAAAQR